MKNKKNAIVTPLATGVFKKRLWPWLFVIAAAILAAVFYSMIAIEFFSAPKCGDSHICETFYDYTFHYAKAINAMLTIVGALVLVAVLCAIIFIRKRSLTITATALTYKNGKKTLEIPVTSMQGIDVGASSIIVNVPYRKFRFAQLKNKKELYDVLFTLLQSPASVTTTVTTPSVATTVTIPTTAESKIRYFQKLLEVGAITPEQFKKYSDKVFATNFSSLY